MDVDAIGPPGRELDELDTSMESAMEVVEAITVAESGRGWSWVPPLFHPRQNRAPSPLFFF